MILSLGEATWEQVRDLDRARAVVILPVGATEAHGPHLPLETDGIISESMAWAAAARLSDEGVPAVILPTFAYTSADFAREFPGTISVSPATVTALVLDVARELKRQGFRMLALANAHLDPGHLASLDAAANACREEKGIALVFPNLTRRPWGARLSDEFRSGACHAGQFETSIVLASRPDLVRESARSQLPENPSSLSDAIRAGKKSFLEANGSRAYFGNPGAATSREGEATIETLGAILADAVREATASLDPPRDFA